MKIEPALRILLLSFGLLAFPTGASARAHGTSAAADTTASVQGKVLDFAGSPLAGVKVVARAKVFKGDREILGQDSAYTTDSGTHVFPALDLDSPPSAYGGTPYFLTFSKEGYRPGGSGYLLLMPGDSASYDTRLSKILDLTLIAGKAAASDSSVAGAHIVLCPIPPEYASAYKLAVAKGNGISTFPDVDPGTQSITVALGGYKPAVAREPMSQSHPKDTVRIALEKSDPDSIRTLIMKRADSAFHSAYKDTLIFSSLLDSLPMFLFAVSDSGSFVFHDIPKACRSGTLIPRFSTPTGGTLEGETIVLNDSVTVKRLIFSSGLSLSKSRGTGPGRGNAPKASGPVPYYFDGKSGKAFDILGKIPASAAPTAMPRTP